jgi:hypothetical protein
MNRSLIALSATLFLVGAAHAESDQEKKPRHEHHGPPEVALEACSASVQGDPCSFEGRRGDTVEGTCEGPDDKPLACQPEGGPPRRQLERE